MQIFKLDEMTRGWFVGDFSPSAFKTNVVEVGVKYYKKGDYEELHHHKIATEITLIISGRVKMRGREFKTNDIVLLSPSEASDFMALEDSITAVVKLPGALNDKYIGE